MPNSQNMPPSTRDFLDMVRVGLSSGRTVSELTDAWTIPSRYTGYQAPERAELLRHIEVIATELRAATTPTVNLYSTIAAHWSYRYTFSKWSTAGRGHNGHYI